ncbi:hypothetical protein ES703_39920 [subsurface metagenome]
MSESEHAERDVIGVGALVGIDHSGPVEPMVEMVKLAARHEGGRIIRCDVLRAPSRAVAHGLVAGGDAARVAGPWLRLGAALGLVLEALALDAALGVVRVREAREGVSTLGVSPSANIARVDIVSASVGAEETDGRRVCLQTVDVGECMALVMSIAQRYGIVTVVDDRVGIAAHGEAEHVRAVSTGVRAWRPDRRGGNPKDQRHLFVGLRWIDDVHVVFSVQGRTVALDQFVGG